MPDIEKHYRGVHFRVADDLISRAKAEHGIDVMTEVEAAIDFMIDQCGETPEAFQLPEQKD